MRNLFGVVDCISLSVVNMIHGLLIKWYRRVVASLISYQYYTSTLIYFQQKRLTIILYFLFQVWWVCGRTSRVRLWWSESCTLTGSHLACCLGGSDGLYWNTFYVTQKVFWIILACQVEKRARRRDPVKGRPFLFEKSIWSSWLYILKCC